MYPWVLESSWSVHGDERGMLRIILVVTHVSYRMPHGENKEYKPCSRWIFLNL